MICLTPGQPPQWPYSSYRWMVWMMVAKPMTLDPRSGRPFATTHVRCRGRSLEHGHGHLRFLCSTLPETIHGLPEWHGLTKPYDSCTNYLRIVTFQCLSWRGGMMFTSEVNRGTNIGSTTAQVAIPHRWRSLPPRCSRRCRATARSSRWWKPSCPRLRAIQRPSAKPELGA